MKRSSRTKSLVFIGLGIALLAVASQIQLPIGPIPFSLQSMVVLIIMFVFAPNEAIATIAGYLTLGAIGLPMGAGFNGGLGWLVGPTGGFLMGFLLSTAIVATIKKSLASKSNQHSDSVALDSCLGVLAIVTYYLTGVVWLMISTGLPIPTAVSVAVLPFVIPDVAKLAVAVSCAQMLYKVSDITGLKKAPGSDSV